MARGIITIVLSAIVLFLAGLFYYNQTSICKNPLAYDIGVFDNRFGINQDKFINTINEAERVWEKSIGRDLFTYKLGAKFKINLLFDQRQAETIIADESKEDINESKSAYDRLLAEYKKTARTYENNLKLYDLTMKQFEQKLVYYNAKVAETNSGGGAKPQEFKELEAEKLSLQEKESGLDKTRQLLSLEANRLNFFGNQINELAQKLNIRVDVYNQRFGEAKEFDQGEYQGNRINVYQFDGISDLRLVLAHELGHALGLDHVENPESIMYYVMEKQDLNNPILTEEDKDALIQHCTQAIRIT